ncbi:hypothetical protein ACS15_0626 [Ralstonia insidiosa]|uniref:Uncharacterized protein n=1 Tax=Ralstonia insidiosa TaxID=190721 RepID=A0AAC9BE94_9RALS|nr:hypothetical protein ACS15_0626 [Ralstonia insidiosa]
MTDRGRKRLHGPCLRESVRVCGARAHRSCAGIVPQLMCHST